MQMSQTKPVKNPTGVRVAVIGVGQVGGATAFALVLSLHIRELLLVDIDTDKRDGHVRDVSDAAFTCNSRTHVRGATHREAAQCDIIVITAGAKFTIGRQLSASNVQIASANRFVSFRPNNH
jgi:L-lactate dehydrogenase